MVTIDIDKFLAGLNLLIHSAKVDADEPAFWDDTDNTVNVRLLQDAPLCVENAVTRMGWTRYDSRTFTFPYTAPKEQL